MTTRAHCAYDGVVTNRNNVVVGGACILGLVACGSSITVENGNGGSGAGASGPGSGNGSSGVGASSAAGPGSGDSSGPSGVGPGSGVGHSGAATSTGTGGGLPPPSEACGVCIESMIEQGACTFQFDQCVNDLACGLLLNCYQQCGVSGACIAQCNSIVPSGVPLMTLLMQCVACTTCAQVCAGSSLSQFC